MIASIRFSSTRDINFDNDLALKFSRIENRIYTQMIKFNDWDEH